MLIDNDLLELIITLEFLLIVLMFFLLSCARLVSSLVNKRKEKIKKKIEKFFLKTIAQKQINKTEFKNSYQKINFLLPIFKKINNQYKDDPNWLTVREQMIQQILVPLARKRSRSRRWLLRLYAAEIFIMSYEPRDEPLLLKLLKDKIPLVLLQSVKAAVVNESEAAINAAITRMSNINSLSQEMYLTSFENASLFVREYVEFRLKMSTDVCIRTECYKILMKFPASRIDWEISKDLNSQDSSLRFAALKFSVYINEIESISSLIEKLRDPNIEIKIFAIKKLVKFQAREAIIPIANCLDDKDWRVRINSIHALKLLGKDGERLLQTKTLEFSSTNLDITTDLSGTWW